MEGRVKKLKLGILIFAILMLIEIPSFAQVNTGKIVGTVTDDQGSGLPGVSVAAFSAKLIGQSTSVTDSNGTYRLLGLPSGQYKLTFTLSGFKPTVQEDVNLNIEQTLTVNMKMDVSGMEEEVTVVGQAPLIDVKSTAKGMTLGKNVIALLPKGRNFDSLMTIIPGVSTEKDLGGTSIDGSSGLENMYFIDGMDTTNLFLGNAKQEASFEFVEEVQIKSSGYQAEFGGSLGGVVNVVSRSGGNEFTGQLVGFYEGSALTGKERDTLRLSLFDNTKAEYVNYQDLYGKDKFNRLEFGFGIGGYIIKDRVWFFGSLMPVFRNTTRNVNWVSGPVGSETYEQKYKWYNALAKITAQPFGGLRLSVSYVNNFSTYKGDLPSRDGTGNSDFPYGNAGFDYPNSIITGTADLSYGNNLLVGIRAGYFSTNTTNQRIKPPGPRFVFSGPQGDSTNAVYPELVALYPEYIKALAYSNYTSDIGQEAKKILYSRGSANLDLTYYFRLAGEHSLKAGFQYVKLLDDLDNSYTYPYFQFGWDQDYTVYVNDTPVTYKGKYGTYAVSVYPQWGNSGKAKSLRMAFYLQDSWTIANRLTILYGLRAENEDVPSYNVTDPASKFKERVLKWGFGDKLAPRIGVVYDVYGDSSLKLFGNFAIYYDVLKLSLAESSYGAYVRQFSFYTLDDPKWWTYSATNLPGTFLNYTDESYPSFNETDPKLKPMAQRELTLGFEKNISNEISASGRIVRKSLLYAIDDIGVYSPGGTIWWVGNPGYGISLSKDNGGEFPAGYPDTPKAKREYAGINIAIDKRLSNNWMGGFSYTWSRLWGNFSGLANSSSGQLFPNQIALFDRWYMSRDKENKPMDGPLWTDRPHFFKLFGSYVFKFGLTVGIVANARSGMPNSRTLAATSGYWPDGLFTDGRTPFLWTTDFFAEYTLKLGGRRTLQFNVNIINLLDSKTAQKQFTRLNLGTIKSTDAEKLAGWDYRNVSYPKDPRYLMKYDFYPPISARFGAKFVF